MIPSKNGDNVFSYIKWRGDLSFTQDLFNTIDGLIISQLTFLEDMIPLTKDPKPLKEAMEPYLKLTKKDKINLGMILPADCIKLGTLISKTNRYGDCLISDYVKEYSETSIEQFCALTYHVNDKLMVIAFQGTDDSLIGWQENFDMVIKFPIPAQERAANYVDEIHNKYPDKRIILVGHSKGGNLSLYAGIYATSNDYIDKIYNYDGPGFELGDLDLEKLEKVKSKIKNVLPSHSTVGMIFNQYGKIEYVKSNEKGLLQHNGFSWLVSGKKFIKESVNKDCLKFHDELNYLVMNLSEEQREAFCKSFDRYVKACGAKTLLELNQPNPKRINALKEFKKDERKILFKFIGLFISNRML